MRRILLPLDGSPDGEEILSEIPGFCLPQTRIDLLHVLPELHAPPGESPAVDINLEKIAEVYLENVARRLAGRPVRASVWRGDPAEEILKAAAALHSDLIAMTTHARRSLEQLLMGSVAEAVVRESSLPVLLLRPGTGHRPTAIKRILVPIDGTEASRQVLGVVRDLAVSRAVEIVLLHVVVPIIITDPVTGYTPVGVPNPPIDPVSLLREDCARLVREGFRCRAEIDTGSAVDHILGYARRFEVDLIAMATSASSGLSHFLLGSVADDVVRRADRPVLLQRIVPVLGTPPHSTGHHAHESD